MMSTSLISRLMDYDRCHDDDMDEAIAELKAAMEIIQKLLPFSPLNRYKRDGEAFLIRMEFGEQAVGVQQ